MLTIALILGVKAGMVLAEKKKPELLIYHTIEGEKELWK